jgi:cyanophycin synthetase
MNIFDKLGFKVILDYGHNPAAIQAMCELTDRLDCRGQRVCVLAAPGDRRNEDIAEIATIAAGHFDHYICRQDDRTRGRPDGEIPGLLKAALLEAGVSADKIQCINSEQESVDVALNMCSDGDLLLIFADKITRSWKQIIYFHDTMKGATVSETVGVVGGMLGEPDDDFMQDERGVFLAAQQND